MKTFEMKICGRWVSVERVGKFCPIWIYPSGRYIGATKDGCPKYRDRYNFQFKKALL